MSVYLLFQKKTGYKHEKEIFIFQENFRKNSFLNCFKQYLSKKKNLDDQSLLLKIRGNIYIYIYKRSKRNYCSFLLLS